MPTGLPVGELLSLVAVGASAPPTSSLLAFIAIFEGSAFRIRRDARLFVRQPDRGLATHGCSSAPSFRRGVIDLVKTGRPPAGDITIDFRQDSSALRRHGLKCSHFLTAGRCFGFHDFLLS